MVQHRGCSIVGTACRWSARSALHEFEHPEPASNPAGCSRKVPRCEKAPILRCRRSRRHGTAASRWPQTPPSGNPACRAPAKRAALTPTPRWCRQAPLGWPVVPDVNWICAISSGATSGSGLGRRSGRQELRTTTTARSLPAGRAGPARTSSTTASRSRPRYSVLHDQPDRLGLRQDIGEFLRQIGRIDRDQREARQRRAELDQHPFRAIRGPDRHMLTGGKALPAGRAPPARPLPEGLRSSTAGARPRIQRSLRSRRSARPRSRRRSRKASPIVCSSTGSDRSAGQWDMSYLADVLSTGLIPVLPPVSASTNPSQSLKLRPKYNINSATSRLKSCLTSEEQSIIIYIRYLLIGIFNIL